jgi:hypothetical protein
MENAPLALGCESEPQLFVEWVVTLSSHAEHPLQHLTEFIKTNLVFDWNLPM